MSAWLAGCGAGMAARDTVSSRASTRHDASARNPNRADPASARVLLTIDHHRYTNHNGGQLAFGRDGDLYIGVGDGGGEGDPENNGQNTNVLLGKLLRIRPSLNGTYTVPVT